MPKWATRLGWTSLVLIAAAPIFVTARIAAVSYAQNNSFDNVSSDAIAEFLGASLAKSIFLALVLRWLWYQHKHPNMEIFGFFKACWKGLTKRSTRG